jgi:predicted metal-dependent TIM-barrel fold hydrolase
MDEKEEVRNLIISIKLARRHNMPIFWHIMPTKNKRIRMIIPITNSIKKSKIKNFLLSLYFTIKLKLNHVSRNKSS